VEEGRVSCVMSAYNAVNGIPATAHKELLTGTCPMFYNVNIKCARTLSRSIGKFISGK
jgi:hypothetical protein